MMSEETDEGREGRDLKIDADWKREAEEVKARLREEDEARRKEGAPGKRPPLPPPSLMHLMLSLSTQILVSLGQIENPVTKKQERDLEQASFSIDLLGILQSKTEGNRTEEETRTLEALLYDLRMKFVAAARGEDAGGGGASPS